MIQSLGELGAYGLQAWLLSVTGAALGVTKIALWVKGSGRNGTNGNIILARAAGKFEGQVLALTERVINLTEELAKTQKQDREIWAPALSNLMSSQNKILQLMALHEERTEEAWGEMIGEFGRMVDRVAQLPCTKNEEEKA